MSTVAGSSGPGWVQNTTTTSPKGKVQPNTPQRIISGARLSPTSSLNQHKATLGGGSTKIGAVFANAVKSPSRTRETASPSLIDGSKINNKDYVERFLADPIKGVFSEIQGLDPNVTRITFCGAEVVACSSLEAKMDHYLTSVTQNLGLKVSSSTLIDSGSANTIRDSIRESNPDVGAKLQGKSLVFRENQGGVTGADVFHDDALLKQFNDALPSKLHEIAKVAVNDLLLGKKSDFSVQGDRVQGQSYGPGLASPDSYLFESTISDEGTPQLGSIVVNDKRTSGITEQDNEKVKEFLNQDDCLDKMASHIMVSMGRAIAGEQNITNEKAIANLLTTVTPGLGSAKDAFLKTSGKASRDYQGPEWQLREMIKDGLKEGLKDFRDGLSGINEEISGRGGLIDSVKQDQTNYVQNNPEVNKARSPEGRNAAEFNTVITTLQCIKDRAEILSQAAQRLVT